MRKWFWTLCIALVFSLVVGCSSTDESNQAEKQEEKKVEKVEKVEKEDKVEKEEKTESIPQLESDEDLTEQLKAEKGIEDIMVQVVDGDSKSVNVDIEINDEQKLTPDEIVDKYGEIIKEKYPDRTIDILVVKDGKVLKQARK